MVCPSCNQKIDGDASFCGYCGKQLTPVKVPRSTVADKESEELYPGSRWRSSPVFPLKDKGFFTAPWDDVEEESSVRLSQDSSPHLSQPSGGGQWRLPRRRINAFMGMLIVLLLIGLLAGIIALAQNSQSHLGLTMFNSTAASSPRGSVLFSSSQPDQEQTDRVSINVQGLKTLSAGSRYDVWLIDEAAEHTQSLGSLNASGSNFTLTFTQPGGNLFGEGNEITVTQEMSNVLSSTNKPLLTARFPPLAFVHIKHLLYHYDGAPGGTALLVGLQEQTSLVNQQAQFLQEAYGENDNATVVHCEAQNIVNLLEGNQGQHFQQLPDTCQLTNITAPGDGFGLLGQNSGYIGAAAAHASLAATAPDATTTVKTHATKVENALNNIKGWLTTVDNDALKILSHPDENTGVQEIVTLSSYALKGMNVNNSNLADPAPGDAGVATALLQGRLMANLALQTS
ncbi:MAG TPA: zinc ribbon domain-containing protein [Ktedonobacteraceae bacterium]